MLPIFKNPEFQKRFEQEGFLVLRLFTSAQIAKLRDYYEQVRSEHEAAINFRSLYSSVETGSSQLLIDLDKFVKETIQAQVESIFQNYQLLISSYLVKESGQDTELMPHQDLSFVDETQYCSFNLWIPLQKTDSTSGQLRVLKGSHKIKQTLRVAPEYPRPFLPFQEVIRSLFTDIKTNIGDCVVINHSVLHGSSANITSHSRVALILGMCSAPANVYYYFMPNGKNSGIEKYKMTAEDYYYFKPDGRPIHAKLSAVISHEFTRTTEVEFKRWIKQDPHINFFKKVELLYFKKLSSFDLS